MVTEEFDSKKKPPPVMAKPVQPRSPAFDYFNPDIRKVAVEVVSDGSDFTPSCEGSSCVSEVFANIPSGLDLVHNSSCVVDCGFSMKLPAGYKCRVESLNPSLFLSVVDCQRFKLNVFNAGDTVRLKDRQKIAKIWVEPVYLFEWIVRDKT